MKNLMKTKRQGALPETGSVFPSFSLVGFDGRAVTDVDFDGRRVVFFFCAGPDHDASARFIRDAARTLEALPETTVLVPVSRTPPSLWQRFVREDPDGDAPAFAPLSVGDDVEVPFLMITTGSRPLWPALVFVDDQGTVKAAQEAQDDELAGLNLAALLGAC